MDDPAKELDFQGVYRITPDGKVTLLTKEMERPNGIGLSPDEKTLYVANSHDARNIAVAFPINADGTLGKAREIFSARELIKQRPGSCDGLVVDQHGNVFLTVPGGVAIISPEGKHLGTLVTNDRTANVEFGEDGSTLFICANHNLMRTRTTTKGIGY
jgi:gluconolactonase